MDLYEFLIRECTQQKDLREQIKRLEEKAKNIVDCNLPYSSTSLVHPFVLKYRRQKLKNDNA